MIEIIDFKAEHMIELLKAGIVECGMSGESEAIEEVAAIREESGKCITGLINGEVVGSAGVDLYWPGVGEIWMMVKSKRKDVSVLRNVEGITVIRKGIERLIKDHKLVRAQVHVRLDFRRMHRLIKILGFEKEGLQRKWMPDGADVIVYSRIT